MKTFYSAEDIENFAEQGRREIRIDENVVLTDLAKQTAQMLGIRLTEKSSGAAPGAFNPAPVRTAPRTPAVSGKPKGCQRRPTAGRGAVSGASGGRSTPVVDQLVAKIKRGSGKLG